MKNDRGRVLIVEDERNMRRVLAGLLEREGYDVLEAPNGARALEEVALESVDVVLTDLKMPQMNGLELLEAIRGRDPALPVILLTAFGTVGSAVEALKQGALDYLTKPFDPEQLLTAIEKGVLLRQRQATQAPAELNDDPELLLDGAAFNRPQVVASAGGAAQTKALPPHGFMRLLSGQQVAPMIPKTGWATTSTSSLTMRQLVQFH